MNTTEALLRRKSPDADNRPTADEDVEDEKTIREGVSLGLNMERDLAEQAQTEAGRNAGTILAASTETALTPEIGENPEARQRFLDRARAKQSELEAKGTWDAFVKAFPELAN